MSHFRWNKRRTQVALDLAEGYLIEETAFRNNVNRRSITRWKQDSEFTAEVDRLTLMTGIAVKAERLKIVKKVARQAMTTIKVKVKNEAGEEIEIEKEFAITKKDLLEWLQFAQSETDGIKLDLTGLLAAFTKDARTVAGSGPGRTARDGSDPEPQAD